MPNPELVIFFPMLDQIAVLVFALVSALGLALSSSNMRRERMAASALTIGVVAHEMRTPLSSAALLTAALRKGGCDAQARAELLDRLDAVFVSMNAIVDYQMGNARLNNLPQQREVVDIAELVDSAVDTYPWANDAFRSIVVGSYETGLMAKVHPGTMRQVIYNLLRNALTALQATGRPLKAGDIELRVSAAANGKSIRIRVIDKGVGIAASRMSSMFEPFQTTSSTPSHGLGLVMCRNAILSFDGEIWCTSQEKEGTTFHIRLPSPVEEGMPRVTIPAALRALDPKHWD